MSNSPAIAIGSATLGSVITGMMMHDPKKTAATVGVLTEIIAKLGMPGTILILGIVIAALVNHYEFRRLPTLEATCTESKRKLISQIEEDRDDERKYREKTIDDFKGLLKENTELLTRARLVMDAVLDELRRRRSRSESSTSSRSRKPSPEG